MPTNQIPKFALVLHSLTLTGSASDHMKQALEGVPLAEVPYQQFAAEARFYAMAAMNSDAKKAGVPEINVESLLKATDLNITRNKKKAFWAKMPASWKHRAAAWLEIPEDVNAFASHEYADNFISAFRPEHNPDLKDAHDELGQVAAATQTQTGPRLSDEYLNQIGNQPRTQAAQGDWIDRIANWQANVSHWFKTFNDPERVARRKAWFLIILVAILSSCGLLWVIFHPR